jgi:acylphosphatase
METVHLVIKGNVQGVYYRASAKEKANELGVKGWIKNSPGWTGRSNGLRQQRAIRKIYRVVQGGPKYAEVSDIIVTTRGRRKL